MIIVSLNILNGMHNTTNACMTISAERKCDLWFYTHSAVKHDISSLRFRDATPEPGNGERLFVLQNRSLQIIGARKEDSGKYVCVALSAEGRSTVTALLDVKGTSIVLSPAFFDGP